MKDELYAASKPETSDLPLTLDEMIAATKQLFQELPECWHDDLILSKFQAKRILGGILYRCVFVNGAEPLPLG